MWRNYSLFEFIWDSDLGQISPTFLPNSLTKTHDRANLRPATSDDDFVEGRNESWYSIHIISKRHKPLNGRLSLSYDHISPQLRRRKFKPRAAKNERTDVEPVFCVTQWKFVRLVFRFRTLLLPRPPPSPLWPQRNPFSSPPRPMRLQTINQERNNAARTVSYSAPWPKNKRAMSLQTSGDSGL